MQILNLALSKSDAFKEESNLQLSNKFSGAVLMTTHHFKFNSEWKRKSTGHIIPI